MVSIVMPVYNAEKYISEAIDSVLKQTYKNFEFIIVDDGSSDQSLEIIHSFTDERIKLIQKEHDYINSLNTAISYSIGKYIARMDADDVMMPNKIEIQYSYMENHPEIDVCGTFVYFWHKYGMHEYTYPEKHNDIALSMILKNSICHPSVLLRRKSLEKSVNLNCLYNQKYIYAEDYRLWCNLIMEGLKFSILPEFLLKYRISGNQVTKTKKYHMKQSATLVQVDYLYFMASKFLEENPEYFEIIDKYIELFNKKKLDFMSLQHIITGILRRENSISNK